MKKLPAEYVVPRGIFFRDTRIGILAKEIFKRPCFVKYNVTVIDMSATSACWKPSEMLLICTFKTEDREHKICVPHKTKTWNKDKYELDILEDMVANIIEYVETGKFEYTCDFSLGDKNDK